MDEARQVVERLRRIDALVAERATPPAVLAEVERLVEEARAWLAVESGADGAAATLDAARGAVERTRKAMIAM